MPLMTVKQMVADILNDMDSDPMFDNGVLEDIDSTEESRQVHQILKTTFFNIIDGKDWPHLYQLFQLTETDATTPTSMDIPPDVIDFEYIKVDDRKTAGPSRKMFIDIPYVTPKVFMDRTDVLDHTLDSVELITLPSGVFLNINCETNPSFWTSFDDKQVVFNSYDSAVVDYLETTRNQCRGKIYPTWTATDDFVPNLPVDAFSYFLNEAKSMCFLNIKQAANPKVEAQATTQRRRMSQEAHKIDNSIKYRTFGRNSKK